MIARLLGIDMPRLKRRGGFAVAAAVVAVLMVTLAVGFTAFAGYVALSRRFDPEIAALIVAGTLLFIALIAMLIAQRTLNLARQEMRAAVSSSAAVAFAPTAASMALRHTRVAAVVGVLGLGFWLARTVGRR